MDYNFNHIAGYETEKMELIRLCEIFNNRKTYEKKGARLPKGIIFYGEAGTGKTLFAKIMANECGLEMLSIHLGAIKRASNVCKRIRRVFSQARKRKSPTMIFFDEIDKVLPNDTEEYHTDHSKMVLAQLLTLIDGMEGRGQVVFVATCNNYSDLPKTLTRPGRLDKKIGFELPTYLSRVEILKMYARHSICHFEVSMEDIAKQTVGFSCAALETLINECVLQSNEDNVVSERLINERIMEIRQEDIPKTKSIIDDTVFACRNIGAFIVAKTFNSGNYTLTLDVDTVCNDYFNGILSDFDEDYAECDEEDNGRGDGGYNNRYYDKNDFLNVITVLYGGYVAEEMILRKIYDNTYFYLTLIDEIQQKMVECGMFGLEHCFNVNRDIPYMGERIEQINRLFENVASDCYARAKEILYKNMDLAQKLISYLAEKQTVSMQACEQLLKEWGGVQK